MATSILATTPSSLSAAPRLDAAFVELFTPTGARRHPLADPSGRLPLAIELPVFADARAMGFQPLGPGFGTVRLLPEEIAAVTLSVLDVITEMHGVLSTLHDFVYREPRDA